ncbi:MAG TPA: WD40 repeat domain-containing protein [Ktedonobacteraceae bacterium]|nr:WD40 repeat domain-containing protein [Ktedonobacteraceae bacterium]
MNRTLPSLTLALPRQFVGSISALAWSNDSTRIAAASTGGSVAVWETRTGACVFEKQVAREHLTALAWTGQGRCLLVGSKRGALTFLHLASGKTVTSSRFSHPITRIAYAPNEQVERFFVVAGPMLQMFTVGQAHPTTRRYATPLINAAWCPAGRAIAALTQHGLLDVWGVTERSSRLHTVLHNAPRCLTWGMTDQSLTIGTEQGQIQDYSLKGERWEQMYAISRFPLAALFRGELGVIAQSACETVLWTTHALHELAHRVHPVSLDPRGVALATAQTRAIHVAALS